MASVYEKRLKKGVVYYVSFLDVDGEWHDRNTHIDSEKAAKRFAKLGEARVIQGLPFFPDKKDTRLTAPLFAALAEQFNESMRNRHGAKDAGIVRRHLVPHFGTMTLEQITLPVVMQWIKDLRAPLNSGRRPLKDDGTPCDLMESSQLNLVRMLSRCFTWAIEEGLTQVNPVRSIPIGKRPRATPDSTEDHPWIEKDSDVKAVFLAMASPYRYMFYICNRSGLRPGEVVGLRMSDLAQLRKGVLRVGHSYDGPLKEDKNGVGLTKPAPASDDLQEKLAPWLEQRERDGAQSSDLLFPLMRTRSRHEPSFRAQHDKLRREFYSARDRVGLPKMTLKDSGRHSMASRNLANEAQLEEVSAALGHSSPVITQKYYNHFKRTSFSPTLRKGVK